VSLHTADYDYALPEHLIARHPPRERTDARMLVLDRARQSLEHRTIVDFPSYVAPGDIVVLNDTRVIPARVFATEPPVELLFLEAQGEHLWKCLARPGRKLRAGSLVSIGGLEGRVVEICPEGERVIQFSGPVDFDALGEMPLPPYLGRGADVEDSERYQTVFARHPGAVAAPTAGLHFTPELLGRFPHAFITLHVGVGTFRPVQAEELSDHRMHEERYRVSPEAAEALNAARRIIAVGTTTTRVLETLGRPVAPGEGRTSIFLHPPCRFRAIDALLTNFHLPKSTLLMLVSAFAGRDFTLRAYEEAIHENYRFYSYGDCMLIL
jgi:S-adenosylmethionine:tRNA ribosyltransferase-isomerase